jgi:hypothetical protein
VILADGTYAAARFDTIRSQIERNFLNDAIVFLRSVVEFVALPREMSLDYSWRFAGVADCRQFHDGSILALRLGEGFL